MIRTYSELVKLRTFEERYNYLRIPGNVGIDTFGFDRYLNQKFYTSYQWRQVRRLVIARDEGCDLGVADRPIQRDILVHHMNPLTKEELEHGSLSLLDPENLITVSKRTHNAIHYGTNETLLQDWIPRQPNDHILW